MSWKVLVIAAVLATLVVSMLRSGGERISGERARELVGAGARLIDVRTPSEFANGHLPGAINIPVSELAGRASELGDKSKPVVLYCRSGARSARAKKSLEDAGFAKVSDLGPKSAW